MSDEENNTESNIDTTINAVTNLVKAVPIYQDAIQPAAKEVGKTLATITKTVNVALAPVRGLVWGYEKIEDFVSTKVSEKLRNTPEKEIVTPKPNVAGPALESLRYTGHEESLRELYANLLAASMDSMTSAGAHPGFVEILKQITPDEAKLLKLFSYHRPFPLLDVRRESIEAGKGGNDVLVSFSTLGEEAGCEHINLTPSYLDNLCRLGIIEIPTFYEYMSPNVYDHLENHPTILIVKEQIDKIQNQRCEIQRRGLRVTQLGRQFISICVQDHASKRPTQP